LKFYFTSVEDNTSRELASVLSTRHEILSGSTSIDDSYDGVVVGMETSGDDDNVALAKELGIAVYSTPELVYLLSQDKQRVVIAGTHGKEEIIACLLHVLSTVGKEFDFVVGNKIQLSDAPLIIIEGSANKSSGLDDKPQFLKFNHHITLITQLSHDHKELYPSFDVYVRQFDRLADATPKGGTLIYCEDDDLVTVIGGKERNDVRSIPYTSYNDDINIGGAFTLLKRFSITEEQFNQAMDTFEPK